VIGVPVRLCELDGLARKAKARAPLERSRWPIDNRRAKKAPAEGDRQALTAVELVRSQPVQLIVSTNRDNYITLNSYQPLVLHCLVQSGMRVASHRVALPAVVLSRPPVSIRRFPSSMTRTTITAHGNRPVFFGGAIRVRGTLIYCHRPFGVSACAVLYRRAALRETPKHGKRPRRDDFLERRIAGRHALRLHDGGGYFGRRKRP